VRERNPGGSPRWGHSNQTTGKKAEIRKDLIRGTSCTYPSLRRPVKGTESDDLTILDRLAQGFFMLIEKEDLRGLKREPSLSEPGSRW